MNKKINILHITDLHLNDISISSEEYLREDNYDSYLRELCDLVTNDVGNINSIVVTGDFVDKGKIMNFDHAEKIIRNLYTRLHINESNVGVCPGNHDFEVKEWGECGTIKIETKDRYSNFELKYVNETNKLAKEDRFYLSKLGSNIFFLSLDSCFGRKANKPSKLTNIDFNKIMTSISSNVSDDQSNILVIASHYPLSSFDNPFPDLDGWYDHHIWRSGLILKERIKSVLKNCRVLWLCGDTHIPGETYYKNQLFVMSGRLGTKTTIITEETLINNYTNDTFSKEEFLNTIRKIKDEINTVHRQARVISYFENTVKHFTYEYNTNSEYVPHPQYGRWYSIQPVLIQQVITNAEQIDLEKADPNAGDFDSLNQLIIDSIRDNNLYQFGRFPIGRNMISLGWVSINTLLSSNKVLLHLIIVSIEKWIRDKFSNDEISNSVLIGLDIWGSVLASQLSVLLNIPNHCKSTKNEIDGYIKNEIFHENDCFQIDESKNLIFLADVISSGNTLFSVYNILLNKFVNAHQNVLKVVAISILNDNTQTKIDLSFLSHFGTCCTEIKLPIIDNSLLPPDSLIGTNFN